MKICIPVKENKGLDSIPYNHFGSAPFFLIYDTDKEEIKEINNTDVNHEHGKCQPLKGLSGEEVDVILLGGIGARALMKLNNAGIKAYKATNETLFNNIEQFKNNKLVEYTPSLSCSHEHNHGCSH